jgi:hypothetical protein
VNLSRPDGGASAPPFDVYLSSWRRIELNEGEAVAGEVVRLPEAGSFNGSRLFLKTQSGDVLALKATAKQGHTVLENRLKKLNIQVGDTIRVTFEGWGQTTDGGFPYRHEEVTKIG